MVLGRYLDVRAADMPGWFFGLRNDWYRPVFELLAAIGWRTFGTDSFGYHLFALLLYAATVVAVGLTAERLAGDRRVGALAALVFAVLQFHTEAVVWFSASSELLAALLTLAALGAYVRYRSTRRSPWLLACVVAYLLALGTKETALVLPALFVAHDLLPGGEDLRGLPRRAVIAPWLLFAVLTFPFLVLRLAAGSPYPVAVTPTGLVRNAGYYALMELAAAPIDIDVTSRAPFSPERRGATLATLAATCGLALLGIGWLRARGWRAESCRPRALAFALVAGVVLLAPVLPIVSERTAFGSSIAVAWAVALVAGSNWRAASTSAARAAAPLVPSRGIGAPLATRAVVVTAVCLIIAANAAMLAYRSAWWGRSAAAVETTLTSLQTTTRHLPSIATEVPSVTTVWIVGLPDHFHYAWAFRNAFHPDRPGADEVLGLGVPVFALLDTELASLEPRARQGRVNLLYREVNVVLLVYKDGQLSGLPAPP